MPPIFGQPNYPLKESINSWLSTSLTFPGDTVLIVGDMESDLKYAYTKAFTTISYPECLDEVFYPRILLGTPGCIGVGIDCEYVSCVFRIGQSSSILDFVQELGRCDRRDSSQSSNKDLFFVTITLKEYVYLHERLFIVNDQNDIENKKNHQTKLKIFHS